MSAGAHLPPAQQGTGSRKAARFRLSRGRRRRYADNVNHATYWTPADKARAFPTRIIPGMVAQAAADVADETLHLWLQADGVAAAPRGLPQLYALHQAARAGRYRAPIMPNSDTVHPVSITLTMGGDCDQWAVVLLAALAALGYEAQLCTMGDRRDPYQHVAVRVRHAGHWIWLDPKGDQAGREFGTVDPHYTEARAWLA